jgi:hypothetical protein
MAFERLIDEIDAEIDRLQKAKSLLSGMGAGTRGPGRSAKGIPVKSQAKKRVLSAKARRAIGEAQRKRWAKARAAKKKEG